MIDSFYTQEKFEQFLGYLRNTKAALDSGVLSDPDHELDGFFTKYVEIHGKVAEAKALIGELRAELDSIEDEELKSRLWLVFSIVKDITTFLDNAEEGSFRTLFFQAEARQQRAFAEIEHRVDSLLKFTRKIIKIWRDSDEQ